MSLTRRAFLVHSAAASLASSALASPALAKEQPPAPGLPIVDTHQHLWDLEKFRPPWLAEAPEVLRHSYTTKEYLAATAGLNLAKTVYMEVDVDPKQQTAEAEHVIALSKSPDHPTAGAVISGRPGQPGFREYFRPFIKSKAVKGVRQVLHVPSTPEGTCLSETYINNVQWLGEVGKNFDLCLRPRELADGLKLAKASPGTRFIVEWRAGKKKGGEKRGREGGGPERVGVGADGALHDVGGGGGATGLGVGEGGGGGGER